MSNKQPTQGQLQQYVTTLAPISQQVGENVLQALQSAGTVAVLSTVVPGVPTDRVVSLPLTQVQLAGVQALLTGLQQSAAPTPEQIKKEDPNCIGFHCHLPQQTGDSTT